MLIGLVGKPNCGKSTFFKAATLSEVLIADYPFATIKPNQGIGYVRIPCIDKEFNTQCNPREGFCINHERFVPVTLLDVAGLVKGASQGKGLGNQFLDDLRQADMFIHIIDLSGTTNEEGKKTENYNPCNDVLFIEEELDLWFLNLFRKVWRGFSRKIEAEKENFVQAVLKQFSGLKINEEQIKKSILKSGLNPEKPSGWTEEDLFKFSKTLRKISKPMILAGNKSDMPKSQENLKRLKEKFPDYLVIPCSADFELALREAAKAGIIEYVSGDNNFKIKKPGEITEKQKSALEFIQKNVLDVYGNTGVQKILNEAVFNLLKYIAIFPASPNKLADSQGRILPDCFLLPDGSTALDFAATIHSDLAKKFIKAIDARTKMALGKEHKLKHRDALEIITR
jgi:hypothetical protein